MCFFPSIQKGWILIWPNHYSDAGVNRARWAEDSAYQLLVSYRNYRQNDRSSFLLPNSETQALKARFLKVHYTSHSDGLNNLKCWHKYYYFISKLKKLKENLSACLQTTRYYQTLATFIWCWDIQAHFICVTAFTMGIMKHKILFIMQM